MDRTKDITMQVQEQIQEVEIQLSESKAMIEDGKAIDRLLKNRDFKRIVMSGYFESEVKRLGLLISDPNWQSPEQQQELISSLKGVGNLRHYLNTKKEFARMAANSLSDYEEALDELREEEAEA